MSDRSALLAAVCANPDDDAPRLVFADWLDENEPDTKPKKGASPSSWAALIRAECELAQLQDDGSAAAAVYGHCGYYALDAVRWERAYPEMCRRVELRRAVSSLRRKTATARRAGLPRGSAAGIDWALPGAHYETDRGFTGLVTIRNWRKFVAALPGLRAACPPLLIAFVHDDVVPEEAKAAVARGFAGWCRDLLLGVRGTEAADLIVARSGAPETVGVRRMRLACYDDEQSARAVAAIADSPNWSGVREFELEAVHADLPKALVRRLFRAPHLRGLTRVSVEGKTTAPAAEALAELPALRELGFDSRNFDDAAARALARAPGVSGLRALRARETALTGAGLAALLASPNLSGLAVLSVTGADLRGLPKGVLAKTPAGGLRLAEFSECQLGRAAAALAISPRLSDVVYFDAGTKLGAETVRAMLEAFGENPPAGLALHGAKLSAADVQALAKWPGAAKLDLLDLGHVPLSTVTARVLAQSPHLRNLNYLHYTPATSAADATIKTAFGARAHYQHLY